ncbi:Cytochrome p450 [Thalictrum thalictroides]|uniref:Cytochrome p450 n=1 Tax=Thalictrum thalictroides TaxID=46969 RepID=A0A7J6W8S5_THATH|nr:Cytochrome p450 [Thalictrum thalictroides]
MDFFSIIITVISTLLTILLFSFCALALVIFTGKSLNNPQYAPVMGTVFDQLFYFNKLYDYQTNIARKYRTYRLLAPSQSELYTTDPRNIEHVLKSNFDKYSKGEYNQVIVRDLFGYGIFAVDGDMWRQQRKVSSFEFSTRVLRDFSCACFRRNAAKLAGIISEFTITGGIFDIQELLARCSLDSIFKVGFGVDLNCLEGASKEGTMFIKALDDSNESVYWRYVDLFWSVKRYFNIGSEAILKKNIKVMDNFVYELIKSKQELLSVQSDCVKEDILSRFLVASEKDPSNMNDKYLRDIILNFILAGKDSTANTLSWFFYMLCKHPLIQEKIVQEMNKVMEGMNKETSREDFAMNLADTMLDKMHYLHATLTETLRLYPAVPVDGRCADMDDILPDGFRLKKGDGVYYIAYPMGRMTYIWGEDAEVFRPERWLNNGVFQPESSFKFVAFHAGPRICLGKDFAYRQMKIIAMVLLRFFRFKLADENTRVTYRTMFTLQIKGGLHLKAVPRD